MPRKGLSREAIIDTAAALAEQKGAENLTLRELAETLGVKTASLYNHLPVSYTHLDVYKRQVQRWGPWLISFPDRDCLLL